MIPAKFFAPLFLAAALAVAALGFAINNNALQLLTTLAMSAALCFSWNLVGGIMGYPSLATASLFGTGIYAGGILQANLNFPIWAAWPCAMLAGGLLSFVLGVILLKLRGHYFAISTIATVEALRELANNWNGLTGGAIGLNVPMLPGSATFAGRFFYFSMWGVAALALLASWAVLNSRFGFALRCIRQNEQAAAIIGVDVYRSKVAAFTLSGALAGAAGAVYASLVTFVQPDDAFNLLTSIEIPVMVLLGGAGTLLGPLLGAAIYVLLSQYVWARFLNFHEAILGLIIVAVIYFLPQGVLGLLPRMKQLAGRNHLLPAKAK